MLLTNGGVLDKFTCQAILGVARGGSILNLPLLDKELFFGKGFNLVGAMSKVKIFLLTLFSTCTGVLIGGYLFSKSQPRSFLALNRCHNCLSFEDLLGLMASIGIQRFPKFVPSVVFETDKTVVIKHPLPLSRIHYVIVPKKDIKNIGEISEADSPYLVDVFSVARSIIEKEALLNYRLSSNGPGFQDVTYLHFHLVGD